MRWLFMLGLAFDGVGALLIAWPVIRPAPEAKEEGRPRLDGNPWIQVLRLREQRYIQAGAFFLLGGFALQFVSYVESSWFDLLLIPGLAAFVAVGLLIGTRLAGRGLPAYEERDTSAEIHDLRHALGVKTLRDARRLFELRSLESHGRSLLDLDTESVARVDHGRWITECPQCSTPVPAWPASGRAYCPTGAVSFPVRFPDEQATISSILLRRPMENRNWFPNETVDDLRRENKQHGIPTD